MSWKGSIKAADISLYNVYTHSAHVRYFAIKIAMINQRLFALMYEMMKRFLCIHMCIHKSLVEAHFI